MRMSNYPDEVESLINIEISFLKKHKYLDNSIGGTITWTDSHYNKNSISIRTEMTEYSGVLELSYTYGKTEEIKYNVLLVTKESNLGNGKIWYFICPNTRKMCKKLHFKDGYFLHRTAFKNLYYEQQLISKKYRFLDSQVFKDYFRSDLLYEQIHKKYFKRYYNGRITKRYAKLLKRIEMAGGVNPDIERLLFMKP